MASDRIYRIAGTTQTTAGPQAAQVGITNPRRVVPGVGRDAGGADLEVRGDELVRVTLGNGFVLWTRADDLLRERGQETRSRGGEGVWRIDTSPPNRAQARSGTRGWLGLGIQVLEFFGVDLQGQTAAKLGDVLELKQLKDGPPGALPLRPGRRTGPDADPRARGHPRRPGALPGLPPRYRVQLPWVLRGPVGGGQCPRAGDPGGPEAALRRPGLCLGAQVPHPEPHHQRPRTGAAPGHWGGPAPGLPLPRGSGGGAPVPGGARRGLGPPQARAGGGPLRRRPHRR